MTDTASPRLSRLIRDTEGFLLPLTEVADAVIVTGIDFDFDLSETPEGAIVLVTEEVHSRAELGSVVADHAAAAALVLPPGSHAHLGERTPTGRGHARRTDLGDSRAANGSAMGTPVLLERSPHVTWSEVLVHLRQLIEGALSTVAWPDVDDLSALAAVIAESTGASITIEDPASRVLAHYNYQRGVWVWNKTGTDDQIRADAGIVMTRQRRIAYAVFANWDRGTDRVVDVMPIMREAGDAIHRFL